MNAENTQKTPEYLTETETYPPCADPPPDFFSFPSSDASVAVLKRAYPGGELTYSLFCRGIGGDVSYSVSVTESTGSDRSKHGECAGFTANYAFALDAVILLFRECVFPCHLCEVIEQLISPGSPEPLSLISRNVIRL